MRAAIYGAGSLGTILGAYITKNGGEIELINRNKAHVEALRTNGAKVIGTVEFTQAVTAYTPQEMTGKYDIIFLDPPYNQGYGEKLLPLLARPLADDGIVLFEHGKDEPLPDRVGGLVKKKDYRYGKIYVTSYVKEDAAEE